MKTATALAFAAVITNPALADSRSTVNAMKDSHILVLKYSPTKRSEITGLLGQPTTFTFPDGESVYRVLQTHPPREGGSVEAAWEASDTKDIDKMPLGNNLTLWPMIPGTTIMTVITLVQSTCKGDHPDSCVQKPYPFKLVAKPDPTGMPDEPDAAFNVIFEGGARATPSAEPTRTAALNTITDAPAPKKSKGKRHSTADANEAELAADRLRTDSFNQADGCHYEGQAPDGQSPIAPLCPLDNGIWTLMRFPGLLAKPAVYVGVCDGHNERLARQHGSGDFVVIEEIAATFCLRLSPYALNIINKTYRPSGTPTNTGTIAPTVDRRILQAR